LKTFSQSQIAGRTAEAIGCNKNCIACAKASKGERDAAHYLDNYLADGKQIQRVLHDFRFQCWRGKLLRSTTWLMNRFVLNGLVCSRLKTSTATCA
jgi:hypothetical protein